MSCNSSTQPCLRVVTTVGRQRFAITPIGYRRVINLYGLASQVSVSVSVSVAVAVAAAAAAAATATVRSIWLAIGVA